MAAGLSRPESELPQLVLASASPRRRSILGDMGIWPTVMAADIDETALPNEKPADLVSRLARTKAAKVAAQFETMKALVVGADTVVVLDSNILGKPASRGAARKMLATLSGRTHLVLTGICAHYGDLAEVQVAETLVTFRKLTSDEIEREVNSEENLDRAGAYGIQDTAALFVERLVGTYHNVVGLPVVDLDELCRNRGFGLANWITDR